jgi:uncharacterized protein involved in exopolysaccharide biosynthesis
MPSLANLACPYIPSKLSMKSAEQTISVNSIKPEDLDFQQYWFSLKRRWLPAATVFTAVMSLAILGALSQKPVYTAAGKLLIKLDDTASLTGVGSETKEFTPLTSQGNPLKTETEVILSNPLLKSTIKALNLKDKTGKLNNELTLKRQIKVKNISGTDSQPKYAAP